MTYDDKKQQYMLDCEQEFLKKLREYKTIWETIDDDIKSDALKIFPIGYYSWDWERFSSPDHFKDVRLFYAIGRQEERNKKV